MAKTALDAVLETYRKNGYIDLIELRYSGYLFGYLGSYYGYVWEEGRQDETEREYGWDSFEEMLNDTVVEIGKTFREILTETPADRIEIR